MMRSTATAIVIGFTIVTAPSFGAMAQEAKKIARIGTLFSGTMETHGSFLIWFRQGLRALGYREGKNYVFVSRWGQGNPKAVPGLAKELVAAKVDAILVNGSPNFRAVMKATRTIPIIVGSSGILTRYVASVAKPGGNVTGSTFDARALYTKRLGLLKETLPNARRVAFLHFARAKTPNKRLKRDLERLKVSGESFGIAIKPVRAPTLAGVEVAFRSMAKDRIDAVVINNESFSRFHQKRLAALSVAFKIPSACDHGSFARAGCLLSYSPDRVHMARRAAVFVDKVLKGAKPAELPVEISAKYKLVINLKTAEALGLSLPGHLLFLADEVVE
ncbi:MAG: ABC transporter substrate-binding protein [Alphaproteobacteria bacterium]|nr:ABC transporter substrate-binding protein [Alphaproteobacteria bacterium]